jgi:hypothetical protein
MIEGLPATTALRGTNLHLTISVRLQGAAGVLQAWSAVAHRLKTWPGVLEHQLANVVAGQAETPS